MRGKVPRPHRLQARPDRVDVHAHGVSSSASASARSGRGVCSPSPDAPREYIDTGKARRASSDSATSKAGTSEKPNAIAVRAESLCATVEPVDDTYPPRASV